MILFAELHTCSGGGRDSSLLLILPLRETEPVLPIESRLLSAQLSDLRSAFFLIFLGETAQPALLLSLTSAYTYSM